MTTRTSPICAFVHVPKTAGSTINDYLQRSERKGESHIEAWANQPETARDKLAKLEWVSGHVPFRRMRALICNNTFRHVEFFTLLRDPLKQLMSHYNWLIEIHHRGGDFYKSHPPRIKEISKSIRNADNSNPTEVAQQLSRFPGLFLNQQARLVFGALPTTTEPEDFRNRLAAYRQVATEETLPDFVKAISGLTYEPHSRKNVSGYHFDKEVFQAPELKAFISKHHAIDLALYRHLLDK
ncbi:hypothetical protein [Vannielia litorea]|uniref:hypothetical protein n=1 Tax=Vannielia litorea TaxID=1217970 RepID=UPI001C938C37|nr:hypothetical protein [Vannielia litorea]MBY6048011.1 sulfotransferase family 2 domain-containing protein [Vannielia litorea]MBY6075425.1 sulfotransferase family 2 domain-containing protein [Vannielia litorea]